MSVVIHTFVAIADTGAGGGSSPVRIQDGLARPFTRHGLVHDWRQVFALLERCVQRRDGYDGPCRLDPAGRPGVPREADTYIGKRPFT